MAEQAERTWTVSFTVHRKAISHQRQDITQALTAKQFRTLFGREPGETEAETMQIEQLAVEIADIDDSRWTETASDIEALDATHFEITEEVVLNDVMIQDLYATASDARDALAEGRYGDCRAWLTAMLNWLRPMVEDIDDKETPH